MSGEGARVGEDDRALRFEHSPIVDAYRAGRETAGGQESGQTDADEGESICAANIAGRRGEPTGGRAEGAYQHSTSIRFANLQPDGIPFPHFGGEKTKVEEKRGRRVTWGRSSAKPDAQNLGAEYGVT